MGTKQIMNMGVKGLEMITKLVKKQPESVISVSNEGKQWNVIAEVLERKAIPDTQDIIGRYELKLDKKGELLNFKQIMLRRRCDLIKEEK